MFTHFNAFRKIWLSVDNFLPCREVVSNHHSKEPWMVYDVLYASFSQMTHAATLLDPGMIVHLSKKKNQGVIVPVASSPYGFCHDLDRAYEVLSSF
jgi:hypothetical protein